MPFTKNSILFIVPLGLSVILVTLVASVTVDYDNTFYPCYVTTVVPATVLKGPCHKSF
jgi:hypothetical protein